jgi:23S rRNA (guanine745-N1)-methyltransferase
VGLFRCAFFRSPELRMNGVLFMSKNKKKTIQAKLLAKSQNIFRCPLCSNPMKVAYLSSLICSKNHCFDLSKRGYVNFLSNSIHTKYGKILFESRKIVWNSGLFERLSENISIKISNEFKPKSKQITMLDAGCGEGTPLYSIRKKIIQNTSNDFLGVGIDISKEAIDIASKDYSDVIWCVSDLANSPFEKKQFNFILNILSPSNYAEFRRILDDDGILIKVIPERDYLLELRNSFYEPTKKSYSNEKTLARFQHHFKILTADRLRYHFSLDGTLMDHLIQMTPLSWGISDERLLPFSTMNTKKITVDLTILSGKPR